MNITMRTNDMVSAFTAVPQVGDTMRKTQLQRLSDLADIAQTAAEVELKRLTAKYGAASAQATSAAARVQKLLAERASIKAEVTRQAIPVPETSPDAFVVFGRVLNPKGESLHRVTVTAVTADGAKLAKAVTGHKDVFVLRVPVSKPTASPKETRTAATGASDTPSVTFQLHVSEPKSKLAFKEEATFQGVGDRMTYWEIIVPQEAIPKYSKAGPSPRAKRTK